MNILNTSKREKNQVSVSRYSVPMRWNNFNHLDILIRMWNISYSRRSSYAISVTFVQSAGKVSWDLKNGTSDLLQFIG